MARAKMMNQAQYPGMYGAARGARPTDRVSNQDLTTAAQQLLNYQRQLQIQRARQLAGMAGTQQAKVQYSASNKQPTILRKNIQPKPKSPKRAPETVTLDDDDDEEEDDDDSDEVEEVIGEEGDDDDGEIVLDGAPEVAVSLRSHNTGWKVYFGPAEKYCYQKISQRNEKSIHLP